MERKRATSHYRRCHVCGGVTERRERVEKCESCGKTIVPFFYFNEMTATGFGDNQLRPAAPPGEVRPLIGLSAVWSESSKGVANR